jgi:uncharacterized protein YecE (DUF72 family)
MPNIYIGTCSWKYDSWRGLVYSDSADLNYLAEYSRKFNTVEIDQWFWSLFPAGKVVLPIPAVVQEYAQAVPRNFKFTVKLPNSLALTHYYRKDKTKGLQVNPFFLSTDLYNRFIDILTPLQQHIGVLMLQFEYLNKQKMPTQQEFLGKLERFLNQIDRRKFMLAIEIRNPNYLNVTYFKFLKILKLSHVFLEGYYMPAVADIYSQFAEKLISPVVIRLHGPDRNSIEEKSGGSWNKIIEPRNKEISRITEIIANLKARKLDVYVNVNNHYEGSAPLTIEKIRQKIAATEK